MVLERNKDKIVFDEDGMIVGFKELGDNGECSYVLRIPCCRTYYKASSCNLSQVLMMALLPASSRSLLHDIVLPSLKAIDKVPFQLWYNFLSMLLVYI